MGDRRIRTLLTPPDVMGKGEFVVYYVDEDPFIQGLLEEKGWSYLWQNEVQDDICKGIRVKFHEEYEDVKREVLTFFMSCCSEVKDAQTQRMGKAWENFSRLKTETYFMARKKEDEEPD